MQAHSMNPTIKAVAKTGGKSAKPEKCGVKAVTKRRSSTCSDKVWLMPGTRVLSMMMSPSDGMALMSAGLGRIDDAGRARRQPDGAGRDGKGDGDHKHQLVGGDHHALALHHAVELADG